MDAECARCGDGIKDPDNPAAVCHCCERPVCDDCYDNDEPYVTSWLQVSTTCMKCLKYTCTNCISVCYDCANNEWNEEYEICCTKCAANKLTRVDCEYHEWWTCGKHETDAQEKFKGCGECYANWNYAGKHDGW